MTSGLVRPSAQGPLAEKSAMPWCTPSKGSHSVASFGRQFSEPPTVMMFLAEESYMMALWVGRSIFLLPLPLEKQMV